MALDISFNLSKWGQIQDNCIEVLDSLVKQLTEEKHNSAIIGRYNSQWIGSLHTYDVLMKVALYWETIFGQKTLVVSDVTKVKLFLNKKIYMSYDISASSYEVLGKAGIIILEGTRHRLNGGSFSETLIKIENGIIVVTKRCKTTNSDYFIQDDMDKLKREFHYLANLSNEQKAFFPQLISGNETNNSFEMKNEFIPAYTLSERIFQDTIGVDEVTGLLITLFKGLHRNFYHPCPIMTGGKQESSIIKRVLRRTFYLLNMDSDEFRVFSDILGATELIVNGRRYHGFLWLLKWIQAENFEQRLSIYVEKCHGDLIFDDMLAPFFSDRLILVDPNGDTNSRLYDLGKLSLSLLSGYEFFKYNQFSMNVYYTHALWNIDFHITNNECVERYRKIAMNLPSILYSSNLVNDTDITGTELLLLNGLHNASLPYFHLLHHRNMERSLAFLLIAIIRLNQAFEWYNTNKRTSYFEAVELCYEKNNIFGGNDL